MEKIKLQDTTLIGNWEEVQGLPTSTITHNTEDTSVLDGLVLKGYETKFSDSENENGERYTKGCIDAFIERYFVGNGLNMPVDIQHINDLQHLAGRVLYCESNSVGFYFVVYIPRTYINYEVVKNLLAEGILQGFSKCGWATDYEWKTDKNGNSYLQINEIQIVSMSLVATPANGLPFEKVAEVKNALQFNKVDDTVTDSGIDDMFN